MESGGGISSGSLRTKISLKGGYSQLSLVCPFYGMKQELPQPSPLLGSQDLIAYCDLNGPYHRYCGSKKLCEDLATFLPQVYGAKSLNSISDASCSLRQLVEKPPITGKEINSLSASQMIGFKLAPGPVPKEYRHFDVANGNNFDDQPASNSGGYQEFGINFNDPEDVKAKNRKKIKRSLDDLEDTERKIKKYRNEEKEKDKKQKKKKKEKKKKKNVEEDSKRMHRVENASPFF